MKLFIDELDSFRLQLGINKPGPLEMELRAEIAMLFDTFPLKVLKYRIQLGLLYRVKSEWENVKHTRFAHSVGVVAKCVVAVDLINDNTIEQKNKMNARDLLELATAAAIHDCGHLPVSHASERALLSTSDRKGSITHEERIVPLLFVDNEYFEEIRNLIMYKWSSWGIDNSSLYRIACLLSPELGAKYTKNLDDFAWPKRAASQLLASELDMDRLDYIIRDSQALKYLPVVQMIDSMVCYVKGFSFEKTKTIGRPQNDDIELCLNKEYLQEAFYCLVARVLLYKYCYFSEEVRGFEGTLTYLLGELMDNDVYLNFLEMMTMSDDDFIYIYLDDRAGKIRDNTTKNKINDIVDVIKKKKVGRFKYHKSIYPNDIKNPRLKEEFIEKVNSRDYVKNLQETLLKIARDQCRSPDEIESKYIMLDIFNLKTGGGGFLVNYKDENDETQHKTLKAYMNGSNMHRLCSEQRIDVYIYSDIYPTIVDAINCSISEFINS